MEEKQREVQDLIAQAQHLLHKAELRLEQYNECSGNRDLESYLDAAQRSLVDAQLSFVEGKQGEELLNSFFRDGPVANDCVVDWDKEKCLLKIFIPDSWERINTRPSIYIKDVLKYRNANRVKHFYTALIQAILYREYEGGNLEDFTKFDVCYAGFLFHFQDRYVRDPDNFMIKILIDAAKVSGIFLSDDYNHFVYVAGGIQDQNRSGITFYFSDSISVMKHFANDLESIKNGENHIRITPLKPCSLVTDDQRTWF